MPVIRTPEERFRDLPGFPFQPHYVEVMNPRIHDGGLSLPLGTDLSISRSTSERDNRHHD